MGDHRPVTQPATSQRWLKMLGRGLLVRCPRCGGNKLFESFFKIKDRCPTCGYKIDREANGGFWLGGYVMNTAIGESLLAVYLLVFAAVVINNPDMNVAPWAFWMVPLAVVPPIALFKMSRTTWMAIDLALHPLEPYEVAEAELFVTTRS